MIATKKPNRGASTSRSNNRKNKKQLLKIREQILERLTLLDKIHQFSKMSKAQITDLTNGINIEKKLDAFNRTKAWIEKLKTIDLSLGIKINPFTGIPGKKT